MLVAGHLIFLLTTVSGSFIIDGSQINHTNFSSCDGGSYSRNWHAHRRIVGGMMTNRGEYPFMVSIFLRRPGFPDHHICGGSIISERWIISAAHCSYFEYETSSPKKLFENMLYVKLGAYDLSEKLSNEVIIRVNTVHGHDRYKHGTFMGHDLLLLHLETPITFTKYIRPVCLPSIRDYAEYGDRCYIAGWGRGGRPKLHQSRVKVISRKQCEDVIGQSPSYSRTFCTLGDYATTCKGDSGGPVICWNKRTSEWKLAGVVAYGTKGCSDKIDVNQRITYFLEWIRCKTEN